MDDHEEAGFLGFDVGFGRDFLLGPPRIGFRREGQTVGGRRAAKFATDNFAHDTI
jgi:hypothetical protein